MVRHRRRGLKRPAEPGTRRATLPRSASAIIGAVDHDELAACLRSWRDRLSPAEAGLPAGGRRRAPGLRREEVAQLAGVSLDYLARLEQGRASSPSPSVLASLARALRLTDAERAHLYRVAGQAEPGPGHIRRHLTPGVQRVLDRLADVPVVVLDPSGQIVAVNPLARALLGEVQDGSPREQNIPWRVFTGGPSPFVRTPEEHAALEAEMVADLHDALGRYPADRELRSLVEDLRAQSQRFRELWEERPVAARSADRKTLVHPEAGPITLDCDVLTVQGSDLRLIVYTAPPGSADAEALALVGAIGLQSFSG
jgi:transcriptional regulator with XRE-family HTH domain